MAAVGSLIAQGRLISKRTGLSANKRLYMYISALAKTRRKGEKNKESDFRVVHSQKKRTHIDVHINLYGNLCYPITSLYADSNSCQRVARVEYGRPGEESPSWSALLGKPQGHIILLVKLYYKVLV
jgi:hypothetical protein